MIQVLNVLMSPIVFFSLKAKIKYGMFETISKLTKYNMFFADGRQFFTL